MPKLDRVEIPLKEVNATAIEIDALLINASFGSMLSIPLLVLCGYSLARVLTPHSFLVPALVVILIAALIFVEAIRSRSPLIYKKLAEGEQAQFRYTIFKRGLRAEVLLHGRPTRIGATHIAIIPWDKISPEFGEENFDGVQGDESGRLKIPAECFETPRQREAFLYFAGGKIKGTTRPTPEPHSGL